MIENTFSLTSFAQLYLMIDDKNQVSPLPDHHMVEVMVSGFYI